MSIQGILSTMYLIVNPFLVRKSYQKFLKHQLQESLAGPCFVPLLVFTWILIIGSNGLSFTDFIQGAPIPIILVGLLGVLIGSLITLSSLAVFGISCATMIKICESQLTKEPTKENLRSTITNFKMMVTGVEPFLLLTYSSQVVLMIIYLYQTTQLFDGCSNVYMVSFIKYM